MKEIDQVTPRGATFQSAVTLNTHNATFFHPDADPEAAGSYSALTLFDFHRGTAGGWRGFSRLDETSCCRAR